MMRLRFATALALSLAAIGGLLLILWLGPGGGTGGAGPREPLLLYCAAGLQPPVSEIVTQFEARHDARVQTRFGGSGALLSDIRVAGGDLFLAADRQYLVTAGEMGLAGDIVPIATQSPVIVVPKGNPKHVDGLDSLMQPNLRLSLAEPKLAAIGKVVAGLLKADGRWEKLWKKSQIHRDTVNQVAADVKLDAADAGIVWDATAAQYADLEIVRLPVFDRSKNEIAIARLTSTQHAEIAQRFIEFLTSPADGLRVFRNHGYNVIERPLSTAGKVSADKPSAAAPAPGKGG